MQKDSMSSKENREHSTVLVPYSYYACNIPDSFSNVPMHWHAEFEINYITHGQGEFFCGDERFFAKKGDILIIPPDLLHASYPIDNQPLTYGAFVFHANMLMFGHNDRSSIECIRPIVNGSTQLKVLITPAAPFYEDIRMAVNTIFEQIPQDNPVSDLLIKSELMRIFWILETNHCVRPASKEQISQSAIIRPALEFMNTQYANPITVEELAKLVHISKSYFMNCFRETVGISAIAYLSQLRIQAACKMLTDSSSSVAEIAQNCGFCNLANFNRQFKKLVGCSPLKYRNAGR